MYKHTLYPMHSSIEQHILHAMRRGHATYYLPSSSSSSLSLGWPAWGHSESTEKAFEISLVEYAVHSADKNTGRSILNQPLCTELYTGETLRLHAHRSRRHSIREPFTQGVLDKEKLPHGSIRYSYLVFASEVLSAAKPLKGTDPESECSHLSQDTHN